MLAYLTIGRSAWIRRPFHILMREARRKTAYDVDERERERERELAVNRRQRSRAFHREKSTVERGGRGSKQGTQRRQRSREKKSAVERGARGIKRGTLHCADDVQRRQRSKEKSYVEGAGREIGLGVLLYASKTAYCSALFQACNLIT